MSNTHLRFLMYPFYKLYYIENVDDFQGLSINELERIMTTYSSEILNGIIEALKWVKNNPDCDLTTVLPDLRHTNKDIHKFAHLVLDSIINYKEE